jgi:DNA invertase Pin-like site-specific DNA recombinase
MATTTPKIKRPKTERVFGVIRVSEQGEREDDRFHSPENQLTALQARCQTDGMALVDYALEINVSGGLSLEARHGLYKAVLAVEAGDADVVMAPALDRLVRNRRVQDKVRDRVQAVEGRLVSLDVGEVTNATPEQDFGIGVIGDANELMRKQISAKTKRGHARATALGRNIGPTPPGYRIGEDRRLALNPPKDAAMHEAFEMRARGATLAAISDYLAEHGINRHPPAVRKALANRVYLGEIHHGVLQNLKAHDPIVTPELFAQVQRKTLPGGRQARSDHLLARQGILRCGTCGAKMSLGHTMHGWAFYRCGGYGCGAKMSIGATIAEEYATKVVRRARADLTVRASADELYQQTVSQRDEWQAKVDRLLRLYAVAPDEAVLIEQLTEARTERDRVQIELDRLEPARNAVTLRLDTDWDRLTLDEQRDLIRVTIARVIVGPGRGVERLSAELLGQ